MHLDATDAVTMRTDGREPNARETDSDAATSSSNSLLNFSDSPFVDDDSWAEPPRAADRRLQIAAVMLGLGVMAIGFFTLGANMGKNSAATPTAGPGALGGRGAGFGGTGLGGAGGAGGGGFGGRTRALLPTIGKVTNIDGNTITMTSADGTTVVVTLAEDTSIGRRKKQGAKNIAVGDDISVRGATAEDGSITATAATVGDVEPSAVPAAGAIGAGGTGGAGGVGRGADGSAVADPAQSGVGGVTPSVAVAGSGLGISVAPNEPSPATTVPSLGGLLPG
jgi:Domain of unknown function (DUF5666)